MRRLHRVMAPRARVLGRSRRPVRIVATRALGVGWGSRRTQRRYGTMAARARLTRLGRRVRRMAVATRSVPGRSERGAMIRMTALAGAHLLRLRAMRIVTRHARVVTRHTRTMWCDRRCRSRQRHERRRAPDRVAWLVSRRMTRDARRASSLLRRMRSVAGRANFAGEHSGGIERSSALAQTGIRPSMSRGCEVVRGGASFAKRGDGRRVHREVGE